MSQRRPGEGRYARLEREQRWLMREVPAAARHRSAIVDRYLHSTRLRLRHVVHADGETFKLGQKVRVDDGDPERVKLTNVYLDAAEYAALASLPADEIVKERLVMSWDGVELVIDRFLGALAGLVLAEIELGPDDPLRDPPAGAVADVTHDDRYSGGALARSASGRQEGTPWPRPIAPSADRC